LNVVELNIYQLNNNTMKNLFIAVFDKLLSEPTNTTICNWGLAVAGTLFFGNLIIHYLILKL